MNAVSTTPLAKAQAHLIRVLEGESPFGTPDEKVYRALHDLTSTRDELRRAMDDAERDFAAARDYISGKAGRLNSLGILQGAGPRIDVLAATFRLQSDIAQHALIAFYEATYEAGHPDANACDGCGKVGAELFHNDATGLALCEACDLKHDEIADALAADATGEAV